MAPLTIAANDPYRDFVFYILTIQVFAGLELLVCKEGTLLTGIYHMSYWTISYDCHLGTLDSCYPRPAGKNWCFVFSILVRNNCSWSAGGGVTFTGWQQEWGETQGNQLGTFLSSKPLRKESLASNPWVSHQGLLMWHCEWAEIRIDSGGWRQWLTAETGVHPTKLSQVSLQKEKPTGTRRELFTNHTWRNGSG